MWLTADWLLTDSWLTAKWLLNDCWMTAEWLLYRQTDGHTLWHLDLLSEPKRMIVFSFPCTRSWPNISPLVYHVIACCSGLLTSHISIYGVQRFYCQAPVPSPVSQQRKSSPTKDFCSYDAYISIYSDEIKGVNTIAMVQHFNGSWAEKFIFL